MENNNLTLNIDLSNLEEDERKRLMALVEKANKPKPKIWKPNINNNYYYITNNGETRQCVYNADSTDKEMYNFGNVYRTKEDAEFAAEAHKVYVELQRYAEEHNDTEIAWNNSSEPYNDAKYMIEYSYEDQRLEYCDIYALRDIGQIYFSSGEIARAAVKEIGENRIKKYLFGVEV